MWEVRLICDFNIKCQFFFIKSYYAIPDTVCFMKHNTSIVIIEWTFVLKNKSDRIIDNFFFFFKEKNPTGFAHIVVEIRSTSPRSWEGCSLRGPLSLICRWPAAGVSTCFPLCVLFYLGVILFYFVSFSVV